MRCLPSHSKLYRTMLYWMMIHIFPSPNSNLCFPSYTLSLMSLVHRTLSWNKVSKWEFPKRRRKVVRNIEVGENGYSPTSKGEIKRGTISKLGIARKCKLLNYEGTRFLIKCWIIKQWRCERIQTILGIQYFW